MENPANRTQHNRGPNNACRTDSTLPETENTMRAGAQQSRGNIDARGDNVTSQFSVPDLNFPPKLFECIVCQASFKSGKALDGHLKKHRNRQWVGRYPTSPVGSFNLNEIPRNED